MKRDADCHKRTFLTALSSFSPSTAFLHVGVMQAAPGYLSSVLETVDFLQSDLLQMAKGYLMPVKESLLLLIELHNFSFFLGYTFHNLNIYYANVCAVFCFCLFVCLFVFCLFVCLFVCFFVLFCLVLFCFFSTTTLTQMRNMFRPGDLYVTRYSKRYLKLACTCV